MPFLPLWQLLGGWSYPLLLVLLTVFGFWLCGKVARELGVHDHEGIVWDEMVGIWITFWLAPPGLIWLLVGFVAFRVLDICKPCQSAGWMSMSAAASAIMVDDVLAASSPGWWFRDYTSVGVISSADETQAQGAGQ